MNLLRKIIFPVIVISTELLSAQLPKPNNYIIFFDFSSRIEANDQRKKDSDLLYHLVDKFKGQVEQLYKGGRIYSEDKISILFYPDLKHENIIDLTSSLIVDFSTIDYKQKLGYYMTQFPKGDTSLLINSFNKIYDVALQQNPNYFGSNIYEFFSANIKYYLNENANNHIIIFTDGYIYMTGENPENIGNKKGHLEGSILDPLRASQDWLQLYESQNWGIISSGYKIPVEATVTVLEMNPDCINNEMRPRTKLKPPKPCPTEFKILARFWTDWFLDMGFNPNDINIHKTSNNLNGIKSRLNLLFRE
jgi:hypothetical protein